MNKEKENQYLTPEIRVVMAQVEKGVYASSGNGNPSPGDDSGFEWG